MKQVFIIGNLGANAMRRNTSEGRELMTFSVAVNDRKGTTWFNVVSSYREKQFPFLERGQQVTVTGDLSVSSYNGSPDISVNADKIELCGRGANDAQGNDTDTRVTDTHIEHCDPS